MLNSPTRPHMSGPFQPGPNLPGDDGRGAAVLEREKVQVQLPPMYKVLMLNDDYTPMEFVVMVLQTIFKRNHETATEIMLTIHHEGKGVCGVYTKDIASTKVRQVAEAARQEGHPLQCILEAA